VLEGRVLDFLGKVRLDEQLSWAHAARKSTSYEEGVSPAQAVWLARARQMAPAAPAGKYSPEHLDHLLTAIKPLLGSVEETRRVPRFLADAGIRLVLVEAFKGSKIDGVSFWLDQSSPVIALSLRFDRIDNFWFVLAHELGHTKARDALNDGRPSIDVELERKADRPKAEELANQFAVATLVDQEEMTKFTIRNRPLFSTLKIRGFAHLIGVHPGIVVGQLHYREEIGYAHSRQMLAPIRHMLTQAALTDGWGHFPTGV
jgi:HTH-type transcriptional regulator/antitoxin HigA